jgi:hypothetical protein
MICSKSITGAITMTTEAAKILGAKGGKAKSEAKTLAARRNASLPRKSKYHIQTNPVPNFNMRELLEYAAIMIEKNDADMMYIDGHPLIDLIKAKTGCPLDKSAKEFFMPEAYEPASAHFPPA